jgi:hypothetical protein
VSPIPFRSLSVRFSPLGDLTCGTRHAKCPFYPLNHCGVGPTCHSLFLKNFRPSPLPPRAGAELARRGATAPVHLSPHWRRPSLSPPPALPVPDLSLPRRRPSLSPSLPASFRAGLEELGPGGVRRRCAMMPVVESTHT